MLRETIAWVAGLARMSWPRFLFRNAFGGIVWATAIGLIAYFGGKALADAVSRYGLYAGAAIVAAFVALRWRVDRRLWRERPISAVAFVAITPVAVHVPALAALALVAGVWVGLHVYELIRWRERSEATSAALDVHDQSSLLATVP